MPNERLSGSRPELIIQGRRGAMQPSSTHSPEASKPEAAMLLDTSTATLNLGRDEMARLDNACDTRIDCVDGVAWITIDGDRRDIVLSRGQSFSVESNQRVIVCALNGAAAVDVHT